MIDHATTTDESEAPAEPLPPADAAEAPALAEPALPAEEALPPSLEERVRRLEDALAQLQDTQPLEARVISLVLEQVGREPPVKALEPVSNVRQSAAIMLDAGRQLVPAAVGALHAHAAAVEARARAAATPAGERPWLIVDLFADVRTLFRMCRDPLYRTVWLPRALLPLGLLGLILSSGIWLYLLPGWGLMPGMMASLIEKVVDLSLAFILCKALQREIRRYREVP